MLSAHIRNVIYYDDIDSYNIDPAIADKMKTILGNLHFVFIQSCIEVNSSEIKYISFYHDDSAGIKIIFLLDKANPLSGGDITDLGEGWYACDFFEV